MPLKDSMFPKLNRKPETGVLPIVPEGMAIPKIIHQTFHSKPLPPLIEENVRRIMTMNTGWEYRFYDDRNIIDFISSNYGLRILNYYNRINQKYGAARADLFRYLLMYKCGGAYLDIKCLPEKPLDDVLATDDLYLLSYWRNKKNEQYENWGLHAELRDIDGGEFQQWYIIAAPGHPFLRAVIEKVLHNIDCYNPILHGTGRRGVLRVTGPIAYTLAIAPLLHLHKHRFVDSQYELGLSYSLFSTTKNQPHKTIFKFHYTKLMESVINLEGAKKVLGIGFMALSKVKNLLLRIM